MVDLERRREKVAGQLFTKKREKRARLRRRGFIKTRTKANRDNKTISLSQLRSFHCFSQCSIDFPLLFLSPISSAETSAVSLSLLLSSCHFTFSALDPIYSRVRS